MGSPAHAPPTATLKAVHRGEIDKLEGEGKTVVVLADKASMNVPGPAALPDEPRRDARDGGPAQRQGVRLVMLTGDNSRTAQAIAGKLGIEWEADLLPQNKLRLVNETKRDAKVAMVGDGVNDAPALATADVGIAIGGGMHVARERPMPRCSGACFTDMAHLVALSRAPMANIH